MNETFETTNEKPHQLNNEDNEFTKDKSGSCENLKDSSQNGTKDIQCENLQSNLNLTDKSLKHSDDPTSQSQSFDHNNQQLLPNVDDNLDENPLNVHNDTVSQSKLQDSSIDTQNEKESLQENKNTSSTLIKSQDYSENSIPNQLMSSNNSNNFMIERILSKEVVTNIVSCLICQTIPPSSDLSKNSSFNEKEEPINEEILNNKSFSSETSTKSVIEVQIPETSKKFKKDRSMVSLLKKNGTDITEVKFIDCTELIQDIYEMKKVNGKLMRLEKNLIYVTKPCFVKLIMNSKKSILENPIICKKTKRISSHKRPTVIDSCSDSDEMPLSVISTKNRKKLIFSDSDTDSDSDKCIEKSQNTKEFVSMSEKSPSKSILETQCNKESILKDPSKSIVEPVPKIDENPIEEITFSKPIDSLKSNDKSSTKEQQYLPSPEINSTPFSSSEPKKNYSKFSDEILTRKKIMFLDELPSKRGNTELSPIPNKRQKYKDSPFPTTKNPNLTMNQYLPTFSNSDNKFSYCIPKKSKTPEETNESHDNSKVNNSIDSGQVVSPTLSSCNDSSFEDYEHETEKTNPTKQPSDKPQPVSALPHFESSDSDVENSAEINTTASDYLRSSDLETDSSIEAEMKRMTTPTISPSSPKEFFSETDHKFEKFETSLEEAIKNVSVNTTEQNQIVSQLYKQAKMVKLQYQELKNILQENSSKLGIPDKNANIHKTNIASNDSSHSEHNENETEEENDSICQLCDVFSHNPSSFEEVFNHVVNNHLFWALDLPKDSTTCMLCNKTFDDHFACLTHLSTEHNLSKIYGKSLSSILPIQVSANYVYEYRCSICDRAFLNLEETTIHLAINHYCETLVISDDVEEEKYHCLYCDKEFNTKESLAVHKATIHNGLEESTQEGSLYVKIN